MDVPIAESAGSASDLNGPQGRIRSTLQIMRKPYETYTRWQRKFGPTYRVKALNGDVVVTSNPENVRRLMALRHDEISQFAIGTVGPLIGENSVILVNGQRHKRARNLLMPPFHGDALRGYRDSMIRIAERVTRNWKPGQRVRIMDASLDLSLEVIIQVVFGVQSTDRIETFKESIRRYVSSFRPVFAFTRMLQKKWLPAWRKFLREKRHFDQLLNEQIELGRAATRPNSILAVLLEARDEDGMPMSDLELKEQLITLLFAGHETTQIAIAWAMSWVHRDAAVLHQLNEILQSSGLDDAIQSEYLHGVCMESLRLNPIVADFLRVVEKPVELQELTLQPRETAGILTCMVHYDHEIYPEPDSFRPQRWLERTYRPHEFLPFGGGVRRCIGATMAIMEMKIALASWLTRFRFELPADAPKTEPVHRRNLTMAPASGIELVIKS